MNIKDLLIPVSLSLLITLGAYLFLSRRATPVENQESTSGQVFEVKRDPEVVTPLNWQINFVENDDQQAQLTTIKTAYGELTFSSAGAVLDRLLYKHGNQLLTTIESKNPAHKTFLLAFSEKTPYKYTFAGQQEDNTNVTLRYDYQLADATITKTFVINKNVPQVDLIIEVRAPAKIESIKKMRLFYLSPIAVAMNTGEIMAFFNKYREPQTLTIYRKLEEIVHKIWSKPSIFGVADKFFVHAMVKDANELIYRGAFSAVNDDKDLLVQLETNEITTAGQWRLSFYLGPKQLALMNAVDNRLEQVLDYGFWSPIAKVILHILNFLHGYLKNYGLAVILFTLLFQLLLMPLSISSQKSIEKQSEMSRKLNYLKQKYRNDPERLKQEQAELVRVHGVGGMMGGCMLLFVQAPIFFALSRLLSNCFELHNERFLWIPNLAVPDPWYILSALFFAAMIMRTYTKDKPITQQLTGYAMALIFAAVMIKLPAGLVLYILTGAVVNVMQMFVMRIKW